MDALYKKLHFLEQYLGEQKSAAIAFSGGGDSAFLMTAAHRVLGEQALAVTARSAAFPKYGSCIPILYFSRTPKSITGKMLITQKKSKQYRKSVIKYKHVPYQRHRPRQYGQHSQQKYQPRYH